MKKLNSHDLCVKFLYLPLAILIFTQLACLPYLRFNKASQRASTQNNVQAVAAEFDLKSASGIARKEIYQIFLAKDFETIEQIADEARKKKVRLAGGYWKLDSVYEAVSNIYAEYPGQLVTDEMWKNRIELLKQWKEKSPDSITVRVALAMTYLNYGWFARGTGTIDTVSPENYNLLKQRIRLAEGELSDAQKLKTKCPRWYYEMLFIGMVNGWDQEKFDEVYQAAIKSEPDYLQFYLVKSESLTPKWNGRSNDWQNYIDALPSEIATLKTDETDLIYFVVVANKLNEESLNNNWAMFAKERIKNGFELMEKKYGTDSYRLNQFAFLSCATMDFQSAKEAFARIKGERNDRVWDEQTFNQMKQFAVQIEKTAAR